MRGRDKQKGAAVVEFAVLISLLIIFLFGIFEFGFLWLSSYYIANGAREGARVAAKIPGALPADVTARENAATAAVDRYLAEHVLFEDKISISGFRAVTYQDGSFTVTAGGNTITVPMAEVSVTVQTHMVWQPILWPLLNILIPGPDFELREVTQRASFAIE